MPIKRIVLAVFGTLFLFPLMAQEDQPSVQKLNVHMMNGQIVSFLLEDEPVTTFQPGQLIITTSGDAPVIYLLENVRKYTHEGILQSIDAPIVAPGTILVRQNNEMMVIDGLKENTPVSVYSADGKLLFSKKSVSSQTLTLPMTVYPAGNYIINAGGTSIKFVKR